MKVKVISLGGSIVAPDKPDTSFLLRFKNLLVEYLETHPHDKFILVVGGGGPARTYQAAYRELNKKHDSSAQDWIGIMATRLNAQLVKAMFATLCVEDVVTDPTVPDSFEGSIMLAAGWKPGFSTDNDAVVLAERFKADTVINLSNIAQVYSADPKLDPDAKALETISWSDFRQLVGETWIPGKNVPFDPIASKLANELGLKVICASGTDIENFEKILNGQIFFGSTIGPN